MSVCSREDVDSRSLGVCQSNPERMHARRQEADQEPTDKGARMLLSWLKKRRVKHPSGDRLLKLVAQSAVSAVLLVSGGDILRAQQSPDDSLGTLHPAEGLTVSLWASEPLVNNPTAMDIDSSGRVWIAEGMNYRMKQIEFEHLKRVEGADRIKVLSDTDGDGKADKETVFAENIFPVPLGMALEEIWADGKRTGMRVYVGNSPDLLVLEDTDGDDKADRRYALLTGFRGVDSDHGLHGMTFGPDGKLYFTVGDARYGADGVGAREATFDVTDKSGRRLSESNFGTTLRCNRDGTQLEVLTSGHRNNYEVAVDSFGNVFGSDNDDDGNRGCRMYWVMDGGQYGYQHPDSTRHWAEELAGIIPKLVGTGNGAPGGLVVYEGDMLPKKYFGAVLQIDAGTHQVNVHPLQRHGAGFRTEYEVLLKGDDAWFRPIDLSVAPDGSLFVCDWYDAGVGGNRFSDQSTGRIYRLSAERIATSGCESFHGEDAIEALQSPNIATRVAARDQLLNHDSNARSNLLQLFANGRPVQRARALHVLHDLHSTGIGDTIRSLSDSDARIRQLALELLAQDVANESLIESKRATETNPPVLQALEQLLPLANDPDAGVRRVLLTALRNVRLSGDRTAEIEAAIIAMAGLWDGRDRYYLEALRAAIANRNAGFVQLLFDRLASQAIQSGWNDENVAVPPFYPVASNDAFLRIDDQLAPSNAASRVAGLAWAVHRVECLPAVKRILKHNQSSSVGHAVTLALAGINDRRAAEVLVEQYFSDSVDAEQKCKILRHLGKRVTGAWKALAQDESLKRVFKSALANSELQEDAIRSIALGRLKGFSSQMMRIAVDESATDEIRAAALGALGNLKHAPVQELASEAIKSTRGKRTGGQVALAALDALQSLLGDKNQQYSSEVLLDSKLPIDVRRKALQLSTTSSTGVGQVLAIHKQGVLPEDLENELSFLLHNHADRQIRARAQIELPPAAEVGEKKIHSVSDVLALQGDAVRGFNLFHSHKDAACARCHRVNGEGALVGPDLASVGIKYGDKELLYHIQFPSGAINYNFVAHTFLLDDGRAVSGLVVDRSNGQIKLGLATGQFATISIDEVDEEQPQTVSLMPKGLIGSFTDQQVADLIEYLMTLRQGDAVSLRAKD